MNTGRVHYTQKGKVKIRKNAFGSTILLWRLKCQRYFVLKLTVGCSKERWVKKTEKVEKHKKNIIEIEIRKTICC